MIATIKAYITKKPLLEKYARFFISRKNPIKLIAKKNIKGRNNKIEIANSATLYNCQIKIIGNGNNVKIEASSVFNNVKIYIKGNSNSIRICNNVRFNRGGSIWIEDNYGTLLVGQKTTFEDTHLAITEDNSKIQIGEDCMFAYDIDVRTGDSHSIIDTITNKRINAAKDVIIGNHVWTAAHVSILKGSEINDNSVVATRSVVTKKFETKNILIAGAPAKQIKSNLNWDRQRI